MPDILAVQHKAVRVCSSVETIEQAMVAIKYIDLANRYTVSQVKKLGTEQAIKAQLLCVQSFKILLNRLTIRFLSGVPS